MEPENGLVDCRIFALRVLMVPIGSLLNFEGRAIDKWKFPKMGVLPNHPSHGRLSIPTFMVTWGYHMT